MTRRFARLGAAPAAATLFLLGMGPALAAPPVAQSSATAVSGSLAGNGTDSGTVTAVHDGAAEQKTGEASPPIEVLGDQQLLNVGVLAQEATAGITGDGRGVSAACAGIAGNGGSVAQIGESRCLVPGEPVGLSVANLGLSGVELSDPESALAPLDALQLPESAAADLDEPQPLMDELGPVTSEVNDAVTEGIEPLGELGIGGTLGAVEASCTAGPDGVDGTANIVDAAMTLTAGDISTVLVDLPANPPPNTEVLVDLDVVATTVLDAVRTNMNTALDGNLAPLGDASDPVQQEVVDKAIAQIAPQLAPLSENVLRIVLNKQSSTPDSIEVTAMSLEVLPAAAEEFEGSAPVTAELGTVTCGPNGQVVTEEVVAPVEEAAPENDPKPRPPAALPVAVASGVVAEPWYDGLLVPGVLALLAATVGLLGLSRSDSR